MTRYLIVNADDFGASSGVNRGILECHVRGIVTSASLMVDRPGAAEAAAISRDHPSLGVGLHWDPGEGETEMDLDDLALVRDAFHRQLDRFDRLLGHLPTHVDSEMHTHREEHLVALFTELVEPLGVPLREDGRVHFVGGFYAQWKYRVTNLRYVRVPFLQKMLRKEVPPGWTEFSCHPGYVSPDYQSVYNREREIEIRTLTDPRIKQTIDELGIRLASYADYARGRRTPQPV